MNSINRPRRELTNGATLSPLVVESTGETYHGRRVWRLVESFHLDLAVGEFGCVDLHIMVPAGFETDYASIPRFFWRLWPHDEAAEAAVVHDWLYQKTDIDRQLADTLLRFVMRITGKPAPMRLAFYLAVRAFGWAARVKTTQTEE